MGNWKSEENINHFLENSFKELAQDFINRDYDKYVDGFTPYPTFIASIKNVGDGIESKSLHCQIFPYKDYSEVISYLEEIGKNNYIFMYAIMPFQIRIATLSSEYEVLGTDRKMRMREKKINELLNE